MYVGILLDQQQAQTIACATYSPGYSGNHQLRPTSARPSSSWECVVERQSTGWVGRDPTASWHWSPSQPQPAARLRGAIAVQKDMPAPSKECRVCCRASWCCVKLGLAAWKLVGFGTHLAGCPRPRPQSHLIGQQQLVLVHAVMLHVLPCSVYYI